MIRFHYLKDHLGNICAVVRSTTDDVVQQTQYYASGVPMQSNTLSVQPYLYNSKELVTAHELNEYEYGFRNYYTTIGRFTSMDPLAEQTPWQSPYSYAGNRFVNAIDWMGLSGVTSFTCNLIVVNEDYEILYVDIDHWDKGIYLVDEDDWDGTYWDLLRFPVIGSQIENYGYKKGYHLSSRGINTSNGGYYNSKLRYWIQYGTAPIQDADLLIHIFQKDPSLVKEALGAFLGDIADGVFLNYIYDKNIKQGQELKRISWGA